MGQDPSSASRDSRAAPEPPIVSERAFLLRSAEEVRQLELELVQTRDP